MEKEHGTAAHATAGSTVRCNFPCARDDDSGSDYVRHAMTGAHTSKNTIAILDCMAVARQSEWREVSL